jgi:hypothetical protein
MIDRLLNVLPFQLRALVGAWRNYLVSLVAIGVAILAGVGLGLVKSIPAENKAAAKDTWALPAPPIPLLPANKMNPDDVADLFWSDEPRVKRNTKLKVQVAQWRFIGTYAQGSQLYALIADDKRVQAFKVGDTLPTGVMIKDVQEGSLTVEQDGAPKTRRLYSKDTGQ